MIHHPNKIQRLQLENFTCFERADLEFSSGINVFIGENGTGKTHLLKILYYLIAPSDDIKVLSDYFGADNNIALVRKYKKETKISLELNWSRYLSCELANQTESSELIKANFNPRQQELNTLYIPPPEMLSWQIGFINFYKRQQNGFEKTFFDLAVALNGEKLKNSYLEEAQLLANEVNEAIKADVYRKDGRFYFKFENSEKELEAPVVAQGINKLGQLYYLILNGSLTKDTILFWDEPETGLNPKYIKVVAQFLQTLANAGVQIFVATHDYLLVNYLSLMAEYPEEYKKESGKEIPPMRFFGLHKGEKRYGD